MRGDRRYKEKTERKDGVEKSKRRVRGQRREDKAGIEWR